MLFECHTLYFSSGSAIVQCVWQPAKDTRDMSLAMSRAPLHVAARGGDVYWVRYLLEHGRYDVNEVSGWNNV